MLTSFFSENGIYLHLSPVSTVFRHHIGLLSTPAHPPNSARSKVHPGLSSPRTLTHAS